MADRVPPVPPASQSHKGTGAGDRKQAQTEILKKPAAGDAEQRGRSGNMKQNTTHQGLQQDR